MGVCNICIRAFLGSDCKISFFTSLFPSVGIYFHKRERKDYTPGEEAENPGFILL